ncbi:MAG: hypothetical protein RKP20_10635 [Candidatus Competibacter sp.]|nr:hypothetical protein [Candidatus Competibacter sp.]
MSIHSLSIDSSAIPPPWRQRLFLLFVIACFVVPLAAAWLLVGHWRPEGSVQHGELLNPARPLPDLRFDSADGHPSDRAGLRGRWVLVYVGSAAECDARCRTGLYDMRQIRLALGKDMERIKTVLLLDQAPEAGLRQWLTSEHAAMTVGVADPSTRDALLEAFTRPGRAGEWIYLLDPLGNLLMRYPIDVEPRGLLKDLQRLLQWSKIG